MYKKITKYISISIILLIGLSVQTENAHALYSSRLSKKVNLIKEDIIESQKQNGSLSILEEIEKIKSYDKRRRETGLESGIEGNAAMAKELIFNTLNPIGAISTLGDSLLMVFNLNIKNNEFISNCLRNEIWNMELLRDKVGSEMLKAYISRDFYHGDKLKEDYIYIIDNLNSLRSYGSNPLANISITKNGDRQNITSTEYFFERKPTGENPVNYYSKVGIFDSSEISGCPDGEFESAINSVKNSFLHIGKIVGKNSTFSSEKWGSIWSMAKANARTKAKKWIRANQISGTIGGEKGGSPKSLVKNGGFEKFIGNVKTESKILLNMLGPATPLFDIMKWVVTSKEEILSKCVFYYAQDDTFKNCDSKQNKEYIQCQKNKEEAEDAGIYCDRFINTDESLSMVEKIDQNEAIQNRNEESKKEAINAFSYHITMDSVAEENIYTINEKLWEINNNIKRGYEAIDRKAGLGIPTLIKKIKKIHDNQCSE